MKKVRTRFAPSPTGKLHIGSIQKIVFSYLCAKHFDGEYILRIEDTDRTRFVESAESEILEIHKIFGIMPDESIENPGKFGPYRQSDRLEIYSKYAKELVNSGYAYYAFETSEDLELLQIAARKSGGTAFRSVYREFSEAQIEKLISEGKKYVIRAKIPANIEISFSDLIMGNITVNSNDVSDYVLLKSDGFPTYHLASVVDDHLMEISHIFRGVEWIATAPLHIFLYNAFKWELPVIAHIPNIMDPNGKGKLSKRSGSVSVVDFIEKGYLPEAIINFMTLLAWSPKNAQEIFDIEELIKIFSLDNFNKSNPVFNIQKLDWFNQQYLKSYSVNKILELSEIYLNQFRMTTELGQLKAIEIGKLEKIVLIEKDRAKFLNQLIINIINFDKVPSHYNLDIKQLKDVDLEIRTKIIERYSKWIISLDLLPEKTDWENFIKSLAEEFGLKIGQPFMLIRIALTGTEVSPPLYEFIDAIGIEVQKQRLISFIKILKG